MRSLRVMLLVAILMSVLMIAAAPIQAQEGGEREEVLSCSRYASRLSGYYRINPGIGHNNNGVFAPLEGDVMYAFSFEVAEDRGSEPLMATAQLNEGIFERGVAGPESIPATLYYNMPPNEAAQPVRLGFGIRHVQGRGLIHVAVGCVYAGCDTQMQIPPQAVMGEFTDNAMAYWSPGFATADPPLVLEAGKSYLVVGQDATGQYRKVAVGCQWLWVESDKIGPRYDDVWNGTPLPTDVVD